MRDEKPQEGPDKKPTVPTQQAENGKETALEHTLHDLTNQMIQSQLKAKNKNMVICIGRRLTFLLRITRQEV